MVMRQIWEESYAPAADLSANTFYAVKFSAAETVNLAGAGDVACGVLQNPASNAAASTCKTARVMHIGRTPCMASAPIAANAKIAPAAGGKFRTAQAGDTPCGQAVTAAGADGDLFEANITIPCGALIA